MNKEKGISKLALLLILATLIIFNYFLFKKFSEPVTEVLTGGAEQSLPALDTAKKVSEQANKAVQAAEDATGKLNEETEK